LAGRAGGLVLRPAGLDGAGRDLGRGRVLRGRAVPGLHRPAHPPGRVGGRVAAPRGGGGVGGREPMVIVALALLAAGPAPDARAAVRSALARGGYPWYDAAADAVRSVDPPEEPAPPGPSGQFDPGGLIVAAAMALGLATLVAALAWAWARFRPEPERAAPARP